MVRRSRLLGAAAASALAVTGGSVAGLAGPALAAEDPPPGANGSCNGGDFCGWRHDDKGGGIMDTPSAMSNYNGYVYANETWFNQINDQHSSVWNRFNIYDVRLYENNSYGGTSECYPRQAAEYKNVGGMEDKGSSHKGISGGC